MRLRNEWRFYIFSLCVSFLWSFYFLQASAAAPQNLQQQGSSDANGASPEAKCPPGKRCDPLPPTVVVQPECDTSKCKVAIGTDGAYSCEECCVPGDLVLVGDYLGGPSASSCECAEQGEVSIPVGETIYCGPRCPDSSFVYDCSAKANGGKCVCECPSDKVLVNNTCKEPCVIDGQEYSSAGECVCQPRQIVRQNGRGGLECGPDQCTRFSVFTAGHAPTVGSQRTHYNSRGNSCIERLISRTEQLAPAIVGASTPILWTPWGFIPWPWPVDYNHGYLISAILAWHSGLPVYNLSIWNALGTILGAGIYHFHPSFNLYFDAQCNPTSPPPASERCLEGYYGYTASPVSLLVEEQELESDISISNFPLEQASESREQWYIWRGSAKAPLLVYDPEHNGEITSAEQLFGHYTFGPERLASLVENVPSSAGRRRWSNGFEALATLDRDGSGSISGTELKPLGLWFDVNRDGVSQRGEVKSAIDFGITTLYYAVDSRDTEGNLWIVNGYERVQNGKVSAGRAVDWFADKADSKFQVLQKYLGKKALRNQSSGGRSEAADMRGKPELQLPHASSSVASELFNGLWKWNSKDSDHVGSFGGYLALNVNKTDNTVSGVSYVPYFFPTGASVSEKLTVNHLSGQFSSETGVLRFTILLEDDTLKLETEADLLPEGKLQGYTRVFSGKTSEREILSYRWIAEKR